MRERLTEAQLYRLEARHWPARFGEKLIWCATDNGDWPCLTARLIREVRERREAEVREEPVGLEVAV